MKKILFAAIALVLFSGSARAGDDLELLSDEMLFTEGENETVVEDENGEKTGIFGFIKQFFNKDTDEEHSDSPKETFLEKSTRLAEEGDVESQMNLAYMYLYGADGIEIDYAKSARYYEMAANQDNPIALNNLGSLYFNGIGVEKNIPQALALFGKAAELGNENAAVNLAFIYLTGGKKDAARNKHAIDFLKKAQEKSNIAKFMLGYAYYRGFVVQKDLEKSFKLIHDAATGDSRIDEAQLVLAQLYRDGLGTVQNYQKAVEAYRSAAMQGNMEAIITLAKVYAKGQIFPQNLAMAHALFNIAAARSVPEAAQMRDKLVEEANMNLEILTQAQNIAQEYKASASELTNYIRQTYGTNIRSYIDSNMPIPLPKGGKK